MVVAALPWCFSGVPSWAFYPAARSPCAPGGSPLQAVDPHRSPHRGRVLGLFAGSEAEEDLDREAVGHAGFEVAALE
jgi:hypothetical protein